MGAVRSFTSTGNVTADDQILGVVLPFTFWGYERVWIGNNGGIDFAPNVATNPTNGPFDTLTWEYGWVHPLDVSAPDSPYGGDTYAGWPRYYNWVGLYPFMTDNGAPTNDTTHGLAATTYGTATIGGKQAFLVTWNKAISQGQSNPYKLTFRNTYQVVIYDDDTWEFNYDEINWTGPYDWWKSLVPFGPTVNWSTDPYTNIVHALGGYRMVTEANHKRLQLTYDTGSGTLPQPGDTIELAYLGNTYIVVSLDTGNNVSGTLTVDLGGTIGDPTRLSGPPDSAYYPNTVWTNYVVTSGGWTATLTGQNWFNNVANQTVDEFTWSRTVTSELYPLDYVDSEPWQVTDIVDGGPLSVVAKSNSGVPGRYASGIPLVGATHTAAASTEIALTSAASGPPAQASASLTVSPRPTASGFDDHAGDIIDDDLDGIDIKLHGTIKFRIPLAPLVQIADEPISIYRYFVADLLTNQILAEIPFTGVSYQRAIKGAGSFEGTIAVVPENDHLSLYENTLPGRTCIYVLRDGECVWGGIIWTRDYDINNKVLSVSGSEFTSYFHHRNIWKTWSNMYEATIMVTGGQVKVNFLYPPLHYFEPGSSVKLIFREVADWVHNGYYHVQDWPAPDTLIVTPFTTSQEEMFDPPTQIIVPPPTPLPDGEYALTTVYIRTDTYDYIRALIDTVLTDFTGIYFPNDEIEPSVGVDTTITTSGVSGQIATLTTVAPHRILPGQVVTVVNVGGGLDGQYLVYDIPDEHTFSFEFSSNDVPTTNVPIRSATVVNKQIVNYIATLTTSAPHGLRAGDTVVVASVDDDTDTSAQYNGTWIIDNILSDTVFTYTSFSVLNKASTACDGTVTATPFVTVGTYGPYSANSDINIWYSDTGFSGLTAEPKNYRGFEVRNVGEELDAYSDSIYGFEYRIDCSYNYYTASFDKTFVMIPINFPDPPPPGEISPTSRFGADQLVFEYPGNISDAKIAESAENAATRFFVVGNIGDLGEGASQPYGVASATDYLEAGWPVLDATESNNDIWDEAELYNQASRYLTESRPPIADITISVNGSLVPEVGTYAPGDWCSIIINDEFVKMRLASVLEPRDNVIVRKIDSIKVSVPDAPSFPETVELVLIPEWQVDKIG
jgi:hypothetical protein